MKITFLGTGTSHGVPAINCDCPVCISDNPKNKRLRSSVLIENKNVNILIDTSPDFRQQFLRKKVDKIDAVLYTHVHADHIFGLDDLRRFCMTQKERIPIFGSKKSMDHLKNIFTYAFGQGEIKYGYPNLKANNIDTKFAVKNVDVIPIPLHHGRDMIFGYRIGGIAYCTDVNKIPDDSYRYLQNLDVLVLDSLREKPHPAHFSIKRAIKESQKIRAKHTFFTHMNHKIDYVRHSEILPESVHLAYDGLEVEI